MPETIKYERIQTADDAHVHNGDFDSSHQQHHHLQHNHHQNHISNDTKIEIPKARIKFSAMQTTFATLVLILIYFCLSIGLTFYQRWLLKVNKYI